MGLQVELPIVAEMDNSCAYGFANSWKIGGFLRELKEDWMVQGA